MSTMGHSVQPHHHSEAFAYELACAEMTIVALVHGVALSGLQTWSAPLTPDAISVAVEVSAIAGLAAPDRSGPRRPGFGAVRIRAAASL